MIKAFFLALLTVALCTSCATRQELRTVSDVNLKKYSGTWYEIAKYPNFFQRHCAGGTTAKYTPLPDGSIQVVNSCLRKDGTLDDAQARATVVPGSGNAKLKVKFGGPIAGDYWIIGLDEKNYTWAVVGHPSRNYLWLLARTPTVSESLYAEMLKVAQDKGYDVHRIVRTPQ